MRPLEGVDGGCWPATVTDGAPMAEASSVVDICNKMVIRMGWSYPVARRSWWHWLQIPRPCMLQK